MSRPAKLGPHDQPSIGPYTLLARLGRGGQGEVYLAADADGNRVAVKVLRVDWDPSGVLRRNLDRELVNARKVAQFVTAKVLDFDVVGDQPYIVSEYIEGLTLAEHVREQGPLKDSELLQVAMQALTALEAIHQAGIIHCDFKPANIILGHGGARVIDFGIAQTLDTTHRVGEIAGSFPYMAPEQLANDPLTSAVDLFAWGSTMVFAATGEQAFPGDNREQVAHAILNRPPRLDGVEEPLLTSLRACLLKDPDRRPTAAQARKLLFGRRAKPVARPVKAIPPTRVETPIAAPIATPVAVAPVASPSPSPSLSPSPSPSPESVNTGKALAALVGAVVVGAVVIWAMPGLSDGSSGSTAATSTPAPASTTVALPLRKQYEALWPDDSCAKIGAKSGQRVLDKCPLTDGTTLYCAEWANATVMAESARNPGSGPIGELESKGGWRDTWSHQDFGRHGAFYSYRLVEDGKTTGWSIWWQDSTAAISCFLHGSVGSESLLLDSFEAQGFRRSGPVPSRS
ncbi:serine/threonine-protein kinase [Actinoplanes subglobosus]|uniref:non-specific serine/threonine protein kinase n=1 Tax=Actinoplanes subglobosus TaxID=1547892 RepID=A0ABV8INN8_9ACTN